MLLQSLFSMRLFTFGWDVFTPTENVVYHRYVQYVRVSCIACTLYLLFALCYEHGDAILCYESDKGTKIGWSAPLVQGERNINVFMWAAHVYFCSVFDL